MPNKKRENPYATRQLPEHSMPKESEGPCKKCKQVKLLGNGYCLRCWDRKTGPNVSDFYT